MKREEFYWVVHIVGGQRCWEGPYHYRQSAERRALRIHGGEVHVFRSWHDKPEEAEREFVGEYAEAAGM